MHCCFLFFRLMFCLFFLSCITSSGKKWRPHGLVTNILDCDMVISKFKPLTYYFVCFRTNTSWKGMNCLIPQAIVWDSIKNQFAYVQGMSFNRRPAWWDLGHYVWLRALNFFSLVELLMEVNKMKTSSSSKRRSLAFNNPQRLLCH